MSPVSVICSAAYYIKEIPSRLPFNRVIMVQDVHLKVERTHKIDINSLCCVVQCNFPRGRQCWK
jgi:hypothetical protein